MSEYRRSKSRSSTRFDRRSRSLPPTTDRDLVWKPNSQVLVVPTKPKSRIMEVNKTSEMYNYPILWHNYYGRTPSWYRDYRNYYIDSPYAQWWYDPESYKNYARRRPDPYLDRTDPSFWRLITDPYYDNRNLWRYAAKSRHQRADDNALAMKLYYERLITFDDLQKNWLLKRNSWANKTSKKWWNEVGLTHRIIPSTYRFPARSFYSFDY